MTHPMRTPDEACCPKCGGTPWDADEETCANPYCANHWTRLIENRDAAEAQRQAALASERRL